MRACQGLGTPTKKPGFYRISGLQSTIVVKNPVSGASRSGFWLMVDRIFGLMGDRLFTITYLGLAEEVAKVNTV